MMAENEMDPSRRQIEILRAENIRLRQSENEAVYRSLFENNHAVMLLIDPETAAIKDANTAACAYYGWSQEELTKLRIDEINTLAKDEIFAQMQLAREEKRRNFFFKHRRADGTIRDVEVYSGPLKVRGQTLLYSIVHDITERRQTEEALRQSEEKFRLAFHTSPDSVNFNRLSDGVYIDINEGFTKLTGYTREVAVGKSSIDLNIWYDSMDRQRLIKAVQSEGFVENLEAKFRRKNGQIGVGLMSASVLQLNQEDVILSITRDITERKQVEDALRESEDKYSQLVNSLTDAILVWSSEDIVYANPAALRLFRANQPGDLIGKRYLDLVHPDDRPESAERIKKSKNEKWIAPRREHRMITVDGQVLHVESTGVPIQCQGQIQHFGIFNDITERKQADAYREMSGEVLQILNEQADLQDSIQRVLAVLKTRTGFDALGIRLQDGNDFPYFAQKGFSNDFLLTENTLIGCAADGGMSREKNGNLHLECICGLVISGKTDPAHPHFSPGGSFWTNDSFPFLDIPPSEESRFHPRNQCIHQGYASVALVPISNKEGIVGLIQLNDRRKGRFTLAAVEILEGIASHIGAALMRKRAEEALRDSEAIFSSFMEHCPVYVFFKDEEARPIRLSRNYEQMLGKPIEDLLGKTMDELFPSDIAKGMIEDDLSVIRDGKPIKVVEELGGRTFETTKFPILQPGKPPFLAGFTIDITERKRADQQREKLEAQLRQAQKMEAIGTLAGGIAHDFNNILSVIIGNAEILEMTDISFSAKGETAQILNASKRAKQLVRQILAFSRQGNQQKLLISLKPVVKETLDFLRASIPSTIQLQHRIDPGAGAILADPTQMQQVLMNLCTNAAHAMEKNGGTLKIELDAVSLADDDIPLNSEAERGQYTRLIISDTGHGIEPRLQPRIFDPYFTTKGPDKGTGLGLSVVHGIVKSHGGIIKVHSEVGKGTAFQVLFPRADGVEKKEEKSVQSLPIGSEKILLIDDEQHLVEMYQRMLAMLGYHVDSRTSPVEAVEAVRANPQKYDLVITDMTMPQMTGYNLAKKLIEIRPNLPVVLCTGFSDQINEDKARSVGILAFLLKPVLFNDLAATLRKVLDDAYKKKPT
jgi:PAS domain S-box-containing protein